MRSQPLTSRAVAAANFDAGNRGDLQRLGNKQTVATHAGVLARTRPVAATFARPHAARALDTVPGSSCMRCASFLSSRVVLDSPTRAAHNAAYRRLAVVILGIDVNTLANALRVSLQLEECVTGC
jgi:hypothetical protein